MAIGNRHLGACSSAPAETPARRTPWFGDAAIHCRVGDVEVLAGPGVFVPAPEVDLFVEMASERIQTIARPTIVEVGAGCGTIARALAAACE